MGRAEGAPGVSALGVDGGAGVGAGEGGGGQEGAHLLWGDAEVLGDGVDGAVGQRVLEGA